MIKPTGRMLILRRGPMEQPMDHVVKAERIILPDKVLAKSRQGTIIDVGPGVREPSLGPGVNVSISWFHGTPYDDKDLGEIEVLHEDEILATIHVE